MTTPAPTHPDSDEASRCDIAARRVRMVDGEGLPDFEEAIAGWFAAEVQTVLPRPEMSRNPLVDIVTQLGSMIYQEPYHFQMLDEAGEPVGDKVAVSMETLGVQQEMVRYMLAVNECPLRLDVSDTGAVTCRVVTPDTIAAWPHPDDPTQFGKVEQGVCRVLDGKEQWTWDRWDVRDRENPVFQVVIYSNDGSESDVTEKAVGFTGWPKRYTDKNGAAVMPWIQYHRYTTSKLWLTGRGMEAVQGTLTVSCLWTAWLAAVRDVGFPTRAIIDGNIVGGTVQRKNGTTVESHVLSPMTILQVASKGDGLRASLDGWTSTFDAKSTGEAVSDFEAGLATSLGLSPADVTRGSQGMSGYALVVSRDGLRRQWARIQVPLTKSDQIRIARTIALSRLDLPTDPSRWRVCYPEVQDSAQERAARVDEAVKLYTAGIITGAEAYMRTHPGTDEDEAREHAAEAYAEMVARTAQVALPPPETVDTSDAPDPEDESGDGPKVPGSSEGE